MSTKQKIGYAMLGVPGVALIVYFSIEIVKQNGWLSLLTTLCVMFSALIWIAVAFYLMEK